MSEKEKDSGARFIDLNVESKLRDKKIEKDTGAHYVDLHVGAKLREKRRENGVSQDELAKAVGLTFQQVQKYEKGLNRISCSKLHDFAKYLKTDIRYFFQGLDDVFHPFAENTSYSLGEVDFDFNKEDINAEIVELVKAFKSIKDPKVRYNILNLVKSLAWH
ncbi:MAG: helix-turn-helix transcriptional regulator [Candidatus Midichloria sp.]|nr:helix-turn-helix transcriptional regulator [Candidatus Midichloria sp.]